jgi:uncharacterized membrane protein YkoI
LAAGGACMTKLSCTVQRPFIFVLFNGVSVLKPQKSNQNQVMKKNILHSLISILAACVLTGCVSEKCERHACHNKEAKQAKLMAEAKVTKADAEKIALGKVPGGTVKEGELEKEKGKLIWSFDLTTPDTKDITEVNVDAITGDVVGVEKEAAESEAKEAAKEKK